MTEEKSEALAPRHPGGRPKYEEVLTGRDGAGRPTKLTEQLALNICKSLAAGAFPDTASAKEGINVSTFRRWLKQGAREIQAGITDSIHARFCAAIKVADAEGEDRLASWASKAAETYFVAALAILERRWPQRWRRPTDDRENKRAVMEAVLKAVIDTIGLVREARPGLTDDELVAHVFDNIELPFEDAPEPTSPRDAGATAPIVVNLPTAPAAGGPVIDTEVVEPGGLEEKRAKEAEKVLKEGK